MKSSLGSWRLLMKVRVFSSLVIAATCVAASSSKSVAEEYYNAWLQEYQSDSLVSQGGRSVAIDYRGDVVVTGFNTVSNAKVYYTAKYHGQTGTLLWSRTYNSGFGESVATSVATDSNGHVIVTGYSGGNGTSSDYLTIKYNGQTGADFWAQPLRYDGPAGGADEAMKVLVDANDHIVVTGRSVGSGTNYDIATIKYTPLGAVAWGAVRYNSASNRDDRPLSAVLDGSSNTIIVGEADMGSTTKFVTIKYLSGNGAQAWTPVLYTPPAATSFYGGTGVATDSQGNIYTVGIATQANNRRLYHLIKYDSAGVFKWDETGLNDVDAPAQNPVYVSADAEGNAVVSYTSENPEGIVAIETVKHESIAGGVLWTRRSPAPTDDDAVRGQVVDGSSNTIIIGESNGGDSGADFYLARYASDGALLYHARYNGNFGGNGGSDIPRAVAVDGNSNTVVIGESTVDTDAGGRTRMVTIKLNRFLAFTGDDVEASGMDDAQIATLGAPAVSSSGGVAARVTLASGKKKLGAIFVQNPTFGTIFPAVQDADAPGVSGGTFKSFLDPVIAPNGRYAFIAQLGGVKGSTSATLWSNHATGNLQLVLRQGEPIAGVSGDIRVKSISDISLTDGSLIALIKVAGDDVPKGTDTILLRHSAGGNLPLLRTGQELVNGESDTAIQSITTLSPAQGSPGQGRWHTDNRVIARVTLANKQVVVLSVTTAGAVSTLVASGQEAQMLGDGIWKSFGLPSIGSNTGHYTFLGTLERGGDIKAGNDTALIYSLNGAGTTPYAIEGNPAPDSDGATYGGFRDPLSNAASRVAFIASLKGKDVKSANSAIYFGAPESLAMIARTGDAATDASGNAGEASWSSFLSLALPNGADAGPIFLAKLSGKGVNGKNNLGVWALSSDGTSVQQIIRTGDQFGSRTVAKIAVLQPARGSFGAARSYNASGTVSVLVTFTDKTQAIINLAAP